MTNTISNQAHVTFDYEGASGTKTNDSNIVSSNVRESYCFTAEKTSSSDCFRAGDSLIYFIHITNCGCACLGSFEIEDNLGSEYVSYVDGSARIFANGTMRNVTPTDLSPLSFEFSERLEKDGELILQYSVTVSSNIPSDVTSITNNAEIKAYGCNCENRKCVREEVSHTIEVCQFAEVYITKSVSNDNVCCGDELDYFVTLTNVGNIDATNVVVTDSLPENFTTSEIHMENNGNHHMFDPSEYDIDENNFLTLPNETGTAILVPAIAPGVDNTTRIRIHGKM